MTWKDCDAVTLGSKRGSFAPASRTKRGFSSEMLDGGDVMKSATCSSTEATGMAAPGPVAPCTIALEEVAGWTGRTPSHDLARVNDVIKIGKHGTSTNREVKEREGQVICDIFNPNRTVGEAATITSKQVSSIEGNRTLTSSLLRVRRPCMIRSNPCAAAYAPNQHATLA